MAPCVLVVDDDHPLQCIVADILGDVGCEVLFASKTPLEFADVLRLRNSDGSFEEDARVVAVQYHPGNTLVAARFNREVPNWIVKP